MSADKKKRGLGRGLDALFRDVREEEQSFARDRNRDTQQNRDTPHKIVRGSELEPIEYKSSKPPTPPPVTEKPAPAKISAQPEAKAPESGETKTPESDKTKVPDSGETKVPDSGETKVPDSGTTKAPDSGTAKKLQGWRFLKVELLEPGPFQPRREFDEQALDELSDSIRAHGILQPLLVRPTPGSTEGMHQIIGGERRWRAAQRAQLHEVPVIVLTELSDKEAMEVGLIENLQRADLSPVEEAEGYDRLMDEFGHTQVTLSTHVGKSRSHIANALRLLKLPQNVRTLIQKGALSAGHARALVSAEDPSTLAAMIISRGLSVRQAEKMAKGAGLKGGGTIKKASVKKTGFIKKDVDTLSLERKMSSLLGLNVSIDGEGGAAGKLVIEYSTLEQLDDLLARLSAVPG